MKRRIGRSERGAALLAVLLLVAVMGALAVAMLEKLKLSVALAGNNAALDQSRAFAIGIESLLALRIDDIVALSPNLTTSAGGWNGEVRTIPLPGGGLAQAVVRDGGNCFNVNSVADGSVAAELTPRALGVEQFVNLMRVLEIPEQAARGIAASAGDWVDADSDLSRGGAEDSAYQGGTPSYRPGNTYFADVSELRAVSGVTPEIYAALRPWLCALPSTDLSPINVNTLNPAQAPLVAMLAPDLISLGAAEAVIAARPAAGWSDITEFYRTPPLRPMVLPLDVQSQPQLRTKWFTLDLKIGLQGAELHETALVDARISPARVVARRWGGDD